VAATPVLGVGGGNKENHEDLSKRSSTMNARSHQQFLRSRPSMVGSKGTDDSVQHEDSAQKRVYPSTNDGPEEAEGSETLPVFQTGTDLSEVVDHEESLEASDKPLYGPPMKDHDTVEVETSPPRDNAKVKPLENVEDVSKISDETSKQDRNLHFNETQFPSQSQFPTTPPYVYTPPTSTPSSSRAPAPPIGGGICHGYNVALIMESCFDDEGVYGQIMQIRNQVNTVFGSHSCIPIFGSLPTEQSLMFYDIIIVEGGGSSWPTVSAVLNFGGSQILENLANQGKAIFVNAAPGESISAALPFGATLDPFGQSSQVFVQKEELLLGSYWPTSYEMGGTPYASGVIRGTFPWYEPYIISNDFNEGEPVLVGGNSCPSSNVLLGTMNPTIFHDPQPESDNLRLNILEKLCLLDPCSSNPPAGTPTPVYTTPSFSPRPSSFHPTLPPAAGVCSGYQVAVVVDSCGDEMFGASEEVTQMRNQVDLVFGYHTCISIGGGEPSFYTLSFYDVIIVEGGGSSWRNVHFWLEAGGTGTLENLAYIDKTIFINAAPADEGLSALLPFGATLQAFSESREVYVQREELIYGAFWPTTEALQGNPYSKGFIGDLFPYYDTFIAGFNDHGHEGTPVLVGGRSCPFNRVMLGTMTPSSWHEPQPEADNVRLNILHRLCQMSPCSTNFPSSPSPPPVYSPSYSPSPFYSSPFPNFSPTPTPPVQTVCEGNLQVGFVVESCDGGLWGVTYELRNQINRVFGTHSCIPIRGSEPSEAVLMFYDVIIVEGGDGSWNIVSSWLDQGGNELLEKLAYMNKAIFVNAAPNTGSPGTLPFGAILDNTAPYADSVSLEFFELLAGSFPTTSPLNGGSYSHGAIRSFSPSFEAYLVDQDSGEAVLVGGNTCPYSRVLLGTMTPTTFHDPQPGADNMRLNILERLCMMTPCSTDAPAPPTIPPAPTSMPVELPKFDVSVVLRYDGFSNETSWIITDFNDTEVASHNASSGQKAHTSVHSLISGDYCFQIFDKFGDGLCCEQGKGSYKVIAEDGGVFIDSDNTDEGQFGYQSKEVCFNVGFDHGEITEVYKMAVKVLHDDFAQEQSWEILDEITGESIMAVNSTDLQNNALVSTPVFLPRGRYSFTIFDAWDDGMCCGFGNGKYGVFLEDKLLFGGGKFGSSQTNGFEVYYGGHGEHGGGDDGSDGGDDGEGGHGDDGSDGGDEGEGNHGDDTGDIPVTP